MGGCCDVRDTERQNDTGKWLEAARRSTLANLGMEVDTESDADADGTVRERHGWTDLVLGPDRPARVVTGLVTGWHAPGASHLDLLTAVAGDALVERAYAEAVRFGYQWHEFGDSCLLLPPLHQQVHADGNHGSVRDDVLGFTERMVVLLTDNVLSDLGGQAQPGRQHYGGYAHLRLVDRA